MSDFSFMGSKPAYTNLDWVPKKAFDKEYSTQMRREVEYLAEHGIEPTFTKTSQYNVRTYKYTKTPKLFGLLQSFYAMLSAEKEYNKLNQEIEKSGTFAETPENAEVMSVLAEHGAPVRKVTIYA